MTEPRIDYPHEANELVERMPKAQTLMDLTVFETQRRYDGVIASMGDNPDPDILARLRRDCALVQRGELQDAALVIAAVLHDRAEGEYATPERRGATLDASTATRLGGVAAGPEMVEPVVAKVPRTGPEAKVVRGVSAEAFVENLKQPDAPESLSVWFEVGDLGKASTSPWVDWNSLALRQRFGLSPSGGDTVYWKAFHMYDTILGPLVSGDIEGSRHEELLRAIQDSEVIVIDHDADKDTARVDIIDPPMFFELICNKSLFNKKGFGPGLAYVMAVVAEWQRVTVQAHNRPPAQLSLLKILQ